MTDWHVKFSPPHLFDRCRYCNKFMIVIPFRERTLGEKKWWSVCRSCMSKNTEGVIT